MLAIGIAGGVITYMVRGRYVALLALDYALLVCALATAVCLTVMIVQSLRLR
jgi:hypothetical protein